MIPVTLSAPGYDTVTVNLTPSGQGAASSAPPPQPASFSVIDTWPGFGHSKKESNNYGVGEGFAIAIDVSPDEKFVAVIDVSQAGSMGGSRKNVVISNAPGNMDGLVVYMGLNSAKQEFGCNDPQHAFYLAPGRHYLNVLFLDPGAAVAEKTTQ